MRQQSLENASTLIFHFNDHTQPLSSSKLEQQPLSHLRTRESLFNSQQLLSLFQHRHFGSFFFKDTHPFCQ